MSISSLARVAPTQRRPLPFRYRASAVVTALAPHSCCIGTVIPRGRLIGNAEMRNEAMFVSDVLLICAVSSMIGAIVLGTVGALRLRAIWRRGEEER